MKITKYTDLPEDRTQIEYPLIVSGMPNEVYHRWDGVSNSGLSVIDRSPAHYKYPPSREPSRAMVIGTALHTAILEPERFNAEYMILTGVFARTASEYKSAVKTMGAENVLTQTEGEYVTGMVSAIEKNPEAMDILRSDGYAELSFFAHDPETGVLCRCRFDWLTFTETQIIGVDLKKTQDVSEDQLSKSIFNYRYYVQQPFYMDVFEWATGKKLDDFAFLFSEEKPPHANRVVRLFDMDIDQGRTVYRENLNTYAQCVESGEWPGIVQESTYVSLPAWAQDYPEIITGDNENEQ